MCLYPKLIRNRKYIANKKNGGKIPICDDERKLWVPAGCGKCIECLNKKKRNWQIRMMEEIKTDRRGKFITLTFTEENINTLAIEVERIQEKAIKASGGKLKKLTTYGEANAIATLAARRFQERWRKTMKQNIKHWLVTELGHEGTERLHMHGILFTEQSEEFIKNKWKYGSIWIGKYVNERTINYIIKYTTKIDQDHKGYEPIVLASQGLGKNYIESHNAKNRNRYKGENTVQTYKLNNGSETQMPEYYRRRIYNDDEREELWTNLLDKNIRYVNGKKIDVSTEEGEQIYQESLKWAQTQNKAMGYGDRTWSKKDYIASKKMLKKFGDKK